MSRKQNLGGVEVKAVVPFWTLALLAPLVEIEWEAPVGCPPESAFLHAIASQVDLRADDPEQPVLSAEVTITKVDDDGWRLTMVLRSEHASDERTFEDDSCDGVVAAAAMVVSLRVVELVRTPGVVPEPSPGRVTPAEEPSRPWPVEPGHRAPTTRDDAFPFDAGAPQPEKAQAGRSRPPVGGWLAVQGGVALGVVPGFGGAVGLEGGIAGKRWRVGMAGRGEPVRRRDHPQNRAVRGRFDLVSAQLLGCGVPSVGPVLFPLCGRLAAGGIRGVGEGAVDRPQPGWSSWIGLGATAGAAWRATRWIAPFVSAELLATLQRTSFSVGSVPGTLHETGPIAFRAWAGLEFHLPIGPQ